MGSGETFQPALELCDAEVEGELARLEAICRKHLEEMAEARAQYSALAARVAAQLKSIGLVEVELPRCYSVVEQDGCALLIKMDKEGEARFVCCERENLWTCLGLGVQRWGITELREFDRDLRSGWLAELADFTGQHMAIGTDALFSSMPELIDQSTLLIKDSLDKNSPRRLQLSNLGRRARRA